MSDLTDRELQDLCNMGNECEAAAEEIARLRAQVESLSADAARLAAEPSDAMAQFVLRMLVSAGHVTQAKIDEAYAVAAKMPVPPQIPNEFGHLLTQCAQTTLLT